jgi:hypothetical protein
VATLIALASQNDPFFAGRPKRRAAAEWFAELWQRLDLGGRTQHLRRVHYVLVSQSPPVRLPNGKPYRNTQGCWGLLCAASKDARYRGLVPSDGFEDRRNPDPILNLDQPLSASLVTDGDPALGIGTELPPLPDLPDFNLSAPIIAQRYQVELWIEKSTMMDVLQPLALRYRLNIVPGVGEISETRCRELVERARASGRPVRVLYISDFDPAGMSMPVAAARKIEFHLRSRGLGGLDVQLRPVALTHEQCVEFELPRTPIKESERRGGAFEERFGEGATELDALEALHPGELRRILEREVRRYYDGRLAGRTSRVADELRADLSGIREAAIEPHRAAVQELRRQYRDLARRWSRRVRPLRDEYRALAERFNSVRLAVEAELEAEAPDLDEVAWPEGAEGDEDEDPLFDSRRGYVEQADRYKLHQDKPTRRRERPQ